MLHKNRTGKVITATAVVFCALSPFVRSTAAAANLSYLYWDANGKTTGSTNTGATGNWDATSTNNRWNTLADGTGTTNTPGTYKSLGGGSATVAVFSAGTDIKADPTLATNAVTLSGTVAAQGIVVKDGSVNVIGNAASSTNVLQVYSEGIQIGPSNSAFSNQAAGASTFGTNLAIELGANQTWQNNSAYGVTFTSNIRAATNTAATLTLNAATNAGLTITGPIGNGIAGGTAGVLVNSSGNGTVTLGTANSYTGSTVLLAGKIVAAHTAAFGDLAAPLSVGNSTVDLATDQSIGGYNTTIAGGATIIADRATAGVGITHTLGTLSAGAGSLTVNGGANVTGGTAGLAFGAVKLTAAATFAVNNPSFVGTTTTLSLGPIAESGGSFGLTKNGLGTLTLSGTNAYSGKTTINAGTVALASGATLAGSGMVLNGASSAAAVLNASGAGGYVTLANLAGMGTIQLAAGQQLKIGSGGAVNTPGSADALVITGGGTNGGLTLGATTSFDIDLNHGTSDTIALSGETLAYNGVMNLAFSGTAASTQNYPLYTFGRSTGSFSAINLTGLPAGMSASFAANTGVLTIAVPEPALIGGVAVTLAVARRRRRPAS